MFLGQAIYVLGPLHVTGTLDRLRAGLLAVFDWCKALGLCPEIRMN
jgi:hypothetical protein